MKIEDIWFEFDEWDEPLNEDDSNADVHFVLDDGTKWCASFFTYKNLISLSEKNKETGENLNGKYFYSEKPVFIEKMNKQTIIFVLNDIIENEKELKSVFTDINK
jgi:hypothetical protein